MKTSLLLLPSLLVVGLSAWMPPAAIAGSETCKNVDINLKNATTDEIQITKLEYYDFDNDKYRAETGVFGIDGKQNVFADKSFRIANRDLEKINNESTQIRVTYRHRIGGNKYEPPVTENTPTFTCRDGMSKEFALDK
jgi:hypothetical protein